MNYKTVEKSILHYTNKERLKRGLDALEGDPDLIKAARGHSRWMAKRKVQSHTGAGGSTPKDRARKANYSGDMVGENLWRADTKKGKGGTFKSKFRWNSDRKLGKAAVITWMNSPGHKRNLLREEWADIGIGVATDDRGVTYFTQDFGGDSGYPEKEDYGGHGAYARQDLNYMLSRMESSKSKRDYSSERLAITGKMQKNKRRGKRSMYGRIFRSVRRRIKKLLGKRR